jgi:hypothetical protein
MYIFKPLSAYSLIRFLCDELGTKAVRDLLKHIEKENARD